VPLNLEAFEKLVDTPRDNAALRVSLGQLYLERQNTRDAMRHLQKAVALDPDYSAAWKWLGRAATRHGDTGAARDAYETGIRVAADRGDVQAAKEMQVFLRRLLA